MSQGFRVLTIIVVVMGFLVSGLIGVAPTAAASEQVTLHFLHMTWLPNMVEVMNNAIAAFEAENPHIKIQQTTVAWADATNHTLITMLGGLPLDIVMTNPTRGAIFREMRAWSNLEELEDPEYFDRFVGRHWITSLDGYVDGVIAEGSTYGLFYRKDLFEAAGLDPNRPPRNWDELVEMGQKLTVDTDGDGVIDQWGLGFPGAGYFPTQTWVPLMYQAGNNIAEPDASGKWVSTINQPTGVQATQFMADLVNKYHITPREIVGMDWEQVTLGFATGKFAMMFNGMWIMSTLREGYPDIVEKYGTAQYPAGPTGIIANMGGPQSLHIPKISKHKEEAWAFLKFFYEGSPSFADQYALAADSLNWTYDYLDLDFAKSPKVKPFADAMETTREMPQAPRWDTYQATITSPVLQDVILGLMTPEEAVEYMDQKFNEMHQ